MFDQIPTLIVHGKNDPQKADPRRTAYFSLPQTAEFSETSFQNAYVTHITPQHEDCHGPAHQ